MNKIELFFKETKRLNDIINEAKGQLPAPIALDINGYNIVTLKDNGRLLLCGRYEIDKDDAVVIGKFLIDITSDINEDSNVNIR